MLKKSLSQNLIKDRNILNKIVRSADIGKKDIVLEIGGGHGDLTRCIARKAGFVYSVEIDKGFKNHLDKVMALCPNVRVIYDDFLEISLDEFKKDSNIKIVGNIPYGITGPIIFKILEERKGVDGVYLTVQKEIAQRILSNPFRRTYGSLSVVCQILSDVRIHFYIKSSVFLPPPKVDSALISLIFKNDMPDIDSEFFDFTRSCFQNKRKLLKYTLNRNYGDKVVEAIYGLMNFPPSIRAEEIAPDRYREMYRIFKEVVSG